MAVHQTASVSQQILQLLQEKNRPLCAQELFFYLDAPESQIYMSLNLLEREHHIVWETTNSQQWVRPIQETAAV